MQTRDVATGDGVGDTRQRHHACLARANPDSLQRFEAVLHKLDAYGTSAAAGNAHAEAIGVVRQRCHALGQRPAANGFLRLFGTGNTDVIGEVGAVAVVDEGGGAADGVGNVVKEAADALDDLVDGVDVHHGDDVEVRVRSSIATAFATSINAGAGCYFWRQCWRKSLWPPSTASTTAATTTSVGDCGGNGGGGGGSRGSRRRTRRYRSVLVDAGSAVPLRVTVAVDVGGPPTAPLLPAREQHSSGECRNGGIGGIRISRRTRCRRPRLRSRGGQAMMRCYNFFFFVVVAPAGAGDGNGDDSSGGKQGLAGGSPARLTDAAATALSCK